MTPTEQRYSAQEREMLAIVYALQKWRGYIEGSPILVHTDHESLKYFLTQKNLGRRLARFVDDIAHFDVEIIYRPDSETIQPLFAAPMDPCQDEKDHSAISWKRKLPGKRRYTLQEDSEPLGRGNRG